MTGSIQISKKLNDGTILVVGGDNVAEFAKNLVEIVGDEGRDAVRALFYDLIPAKAGGTDSYESNIAAQFPGSRPVREAYAESATQPDWYAAESATQPDWQAAESAARPVPDWQVDRQSNGPGRAHPQQAGPSDAPGVAPFCPNHHQPARWVPPGVAKATQKPYSGFFACNVSEQGDRSCRVPR